MVGINWDRRPLLMGIMFPTSYWEFESSPPILPIVIEINTKIVNGKLKSEIVIGLKMY